MARDGAAAVGSSTKKRKLVRPRKSESDAVKRESGAGSEAEAPAPSGGLPEPYAPQIGTRNRYQTKNGKGPGRRPEEALLVESDTDDQPENGKGPGRRPEEALLVESDTDEEEVVSRFPAFNYEDMEDDTAEVAAVAAAVAARAAEEAAP